MFYFRVLKLENILYHHHKYTRKKHTHKCIHTYIENKFFELVISFLYFLNKEITLPAIERTRTQLSY